MVRPGPNWMMPVAPQEIALRVLLRIYIILPSMRASPPNANSPVKLPAGMVRNSLKTEEWTKIEETLKSLTNLKELYLDLSDN